MSTRRTNVKIPSGDSYCAAWHYQGTNGALIAMAGGLAVTKGAGTDRFATRFAATGFHVLAFDYRCLGGSGGQPRQVTKLKQQLDDWQAVLSFARELPDVDPRRLAIWGFSASGGHIFRVAARNPDLAAAIAQGPLADGVDAALFAARHQAFVDGLKLMGLAVIDAIGGRLGREPLLVPLAGERGTVASLTTPDSRNGSRALNPDGAYDEEWQQEIAARSALTPAFYRPGRDAPKIKPPILVVVSDRDGVAPPAPGRKAAERAPRGEFLEVEGGHYAPYEEAFERAVSAEAEFLTRHLLAGKDGGHAVDRASGRRPAASAA